MKIIDTLKQVWGFVGVVIDLLFLYSLLTSNGILGFLSAWFGSYASTLYDIFVLIVLISLTLLLFWLGHRYYVPMSEFIGRRLKIPVIKVRKTSSEEKEDIYKPLRRDVEKLIERVRMLGLIEDCISSQQPLTFWKELEGRIPSNFYSELEDIFETRLKEYYGWLRASKNFIRYKIYFYVNMQLDKLQEEYKGLGVGSFEYHLYSSLVIPVIHGDDVSVAWFEGHDPNLWENIEKCPHSKDIRTLLEWLKERNPCIETLRKNQSDLIKLAENLRDELNRKIK
jgi:hypothetical protein